MHCLLQATPWSYNLIPNRRSHRIELRLFQHRTPAWCLSGLNRDMLLNTKSRRMDWYLHFIFWMINYAASSNCVSDFIVKTWIRHRYRAQTQVLVPWPVSNPRFSFTSEHLWNIISISANQHSRNEAPPLILWIRIKTDLFNCGVKSGEASAKSRDDALLS